MISNAAPLPSIDQFTGHYVLVKDRSDDLQAAIERATAGMNFFTRPIARRQLRQKTILCPSFSMEKNDGFLHIVLTGEPPLSLPLSGATVPWKAADGETVRVHLVSGPELTQIFDAKQGRRENRFTFSSDRAVLTMNVKITSQQLPRPVEYRLVYRKV